jgi:glycosyltransferase involved in cell wall biosynthesis
MRLRNALQEEIMKCTVCHVHGLWLPHALAARSVAKKLGKAVISSTHGALSRWELRKPRKRLKKAVYSSLFERRSLESSDCIRALSRREAEDIREYGVKAPIAIVPTGVEEIRRVEPAEFYRRFPHLGDKQCVLFLGRVHFQKGIVELVQAWIRVAAQWKEAHLVITGPDHPPTRERLMQTLRTHHLEDRVTFTGILTGDFKLAALSIATYFCLPSFSEGLSVAVLESLSIGLPVILSQTCNMDGVDTYGAGLVTSSNPDDLAEALSAGLSASDAQWAAMSANAKKLARECYGWDGAAQQMAGVYS